MAGRQHKRKLIMRQIFLTAGLIAGVCLYAVFSISTAAECHMKGGELVRGLVWFKCVEPIE